MKCHVQTICLLSSLEGPCGCATVAIVPSHRRRDLSRLVRPPRPRLSQSCCGTYFKGLGVAVRVDRFSGPDHHSRSISYHSGEFVLDPLSETSTSVLSQQQTSVLSQQQTPVLSLSQQQTSASAFITQHQHSSHGPGPWLNPGWDRPAHPSIPI